MSYRDLPTPQGPTDTTHLAILFTRARLRKGWSYEKLAVESELGYRTATMACRTGRCSSETALKLIVTLGLSLVMPQSQPLTASQAQFGR
jgi:hypothetical protein